MQKIPAAQFKAQCLAVMDKVAQSGRPVMVTKHGKPVVQISRVESNCRAYAANAFRNSVRPV